MLIQKAPLPLVHSHSVSYGRFKLRLVDFLSIEYWTLLNTIVQYSMERKSTKRRLNHIDRAKLFDRAESLPRREKQNQESLVYYSIVSSPLIKRESKHFHFLKISSNTNSSKTWHLQDLTRTSASLSPLRTIWTSETGRVYRCRESR